jgi:long-chain acyl-CoA synthetase
MLLPEDFSVENGTLTATLKLKRKEVIKKYAAEIDAMYSKPSL